MGTQKPSAPISSSVSEWEGEAFRVKTDIGAG